MTLVLLCQEFECRLSSQVAVSADEPARCAAAHLLSTSIKQRSTLSAINWRRSLFEQTCVTTLATFDKFDMPWRKKQLLS